MRNYFAGITDDGGIRQHPWTLSEKDSSGRYYDFKQEPHLIPVVLEDFKQWEHHQAIKKFYKLVEWINSPGTHLESNDCRLRGPKINQQKDLCNKELLFSGGFMVLFRNLKLGLSEDGAQWASRQVGEAQPPYYTPNKYMEWFVNRSLQLIDEINSGYSQACIAVHLYPTYYKDAPVQEEHRFGYQIAFEFWAWGDDENEALDAFGVVVDTLSKCLRQMSSEITK